jgi:hypothetical protein
MGGKVLVPTTEAVQKLIAARMAADVYGVPTLVIARTDAEAADLLTSDYDENDKPFLTGERTAEGFYKTKKGLDQAISRAIAYADYADLVWCETGTPDLEFARKFAEAVHAKVHPGKMLAYNCSPSFNWKKNLDDATIAKFQKELGAMGYKYQFITLAGIHSMWYNMFDLAQDYAPAACRPTSRRFRSRNSLPRPWLHLRFAPAGSRHRLLRRSHHRDPGRQVQRHRADRLDRRRTVPLRSYRLKLLPHPAAAEAGTHKAPAFFVYAGCQLPCRTAERLSGRKTKNNAGPQQMRCEQNTPQQ